jgi:hypothetical protein
MNDAWVPVPLRWKHVLAGDVFVGKDGALWTVTETNGLGRGIVTVRRTSEQTYSAPVNPDAVVSVLVPVLERDALRVCRDELGAQLEARE